jgi:AcrR family transcriptional regulator
VPAAADRPGSAEWWRQRYADPPRRRPRADGLTLEGVVDAAIALVDAEGLDALTMRRLATALDSAHTSLYRHVAGRDELLVLMVDRILGEVASGDDPALDPRARAEALLRRYRRVLLAHPAIAPLAARGQLLGPHALAGRQLGLALLVEAGADPALAVEAYLTLTHFVIGSAVLETGGAARTASEREAMAELFAGLDPEGLPLVVALAADLNLPDPDREFSFGLTALLDGIEARIRTAR